jgi:protein TonB
MITKKSKKSNLENKKAIFFEIGMVLALSIALIAFEWSTTESPANAPIAGWDEIYEEDYNEVIRLEVEKIIMPPQPTYEIVIVDDEVEIEEPDFDFDIDIDPDAIVIPPLTDEPPVDDDVPVYFAEEMPRYRNGERINFKRHMQQIVNYPEEAIHLDLEGTVHVQFVVDKHGNIKDIKIIRGIDPLLDNEVIAAIHQSEKWEPGRQNGHAVNVAMSIPIVFRLQ